MDERLIEVAFPLKQTSLESVHEKNVRHGHISTLHMWPARRPLAACRAALIATLLPDPGNTEERKELLERLGGRVVQHVISKKLPGGRIEEQITETTEGGILQWGQESNEDLNWFREKILAAYGGRAPKVLDPFAGGGAIPLEAMRLGCEVTAVDINPVAWSSSNVPLNTHSDSLTTTVHCRILLANHVNLWNPISKPKGSKVQPCMYNLNRLA